MRGTVRPIRVPVLEIGSQAGVAAREMRIIIPAHNEADRLSETVTNLWSHFGPRATLLVVANGCSDDTAGVARSLARRYPTVELLEIRHQIGKGGAVRAGLTLGSEPYVAFIDADGSTTADQLDVLYQACVERKLSGAIGSRWLPGSRIARKQPFQRRLASRAFNRITRLVFGLKFTDTQCGAKVFERAAIDSVLHKLEIANFAFDVDVLLALQKLGKPVAEIAISWENVVEYSKVRLIRSGPTMLWALLRLSIRESVLSHVPFLDALGRSQTIPVRCGLDVLFLLPRRHVASAKFEALVSGLQARGHMARVVRTEELGSLAGLAMWYLRSGHRQTDVIVHASGSLGSQILAWSAKPKFSLLEVESRADRSELAVDEFIKETIRATHSNLYLRRNDDGWTFATQQLEPASIDPI